MYPANYTYGKFYKQLTIEGFQVKFFYHPSGIMAWWNDGIMYEIGKFTSRSVLWQGAQDGSPGEFCQQEKDQCR